MWGTRRLSREGIHPRKIGKAREAAITRGNGCAVFDGDRRQVRVRNEIAASVRVIQQATQDLPVPSARGNRDAGWLLDEPVDERYRRGQ